MDLESGQRATEIEFLKAYINDLNCIVALPAAWSGGTASQILGTSLDVLRDVLHLDFVYARLKEPARLEMARVAQPDRLAIEPSQIAAMLRRCLGDDPAKWPSQSQSKIGSNDVSIAILRL